MSKVFCPWFWRKLPISQVGVSFSCCPWLAGSQGLVSGKWPQPLWFSRYLQGLGSGKWPKPTDTNGFHAICRVLSVTSCQNHCFHGASTVLAVASGQNPWFSCFFARGFHCICRALAVASGQNPRFSLYLQGLGSGKWPKPMVFMALAVLSSPNPCFHGICRVLAVASGQKQSFFSWFLQGFGGGQNLDRFGCR